MISAIGMLVRLESVFSKSALTISGATNAPFKLPEMQLGVPIPKSLFWIGKPPILGYNMYGHAHLMAYLHEGLWCDMHWQFPTILLVGMTRCNVVVRIWYGDSIDMCAEKPAFRTRLRPILTISTRCQTGWNVTKCHTCNAKRHHNLLGNLRKGEVSASPLDTARPQENQRLEMRRVGASKRAFRARLPPIFIICSFKIDVFLRLQICYLKIDVSCKASVNFHHISQSATPATEFAPCRHLTQPWECDSQKTRSATRLKSCACHAKWRWTRLKCCACRENCSGSSENVAKVLRLPHKATFDTLQNTSECHEMPHLPRETKQRDVWNLQKWPSLQNLP